MKENNHNINNKLNIIIVIAIVFLLGILIGFLLVPKKTIEVEKVINQNQNNSSSIHREIPIVGVDNKGHGVAGQIFVDVKPGTGLVLVNINNVLADYQTQISARTAAKIASNFTQVNISSLDVIYNIKANASIVEGPSAGSAMTLATIAAIENKTINDSVFITGTIEDDGSIGTVGGIGEKAKAAKDNNAKLFLIPDAKYNVGYNEVKECKDLDSIKYCEIVYLPRKTDLSQLLQLEIVPVKNITEAVKYVII